MEDFIATFMSTGGEIVGGWWIEQRFAHFGVILAYVFLVGGTFTLFGD